MGFAVTTNLPPELAELEDLYEIVDGQKVWPRVGEPETDALYEIVDGQRKEIPRMGAFAGVFASILSQFLNSFALPQKLGFAVVEVMFQIISGRPNRRPDVAFVRAERWPIHEIPKEDPLAWNTVPNLAVEVLGPTNTIGEIEDKIEDYFAAGVQLVWVVHPLRQRIYGYESPTQVRILTENDELEGGDVLPGFRLGIAALFAALVLPAASEGPLSS